MASHERFHLKDLEQLAAKAAELGVELPVDADVSILGDSVAIGDRSMPNRFVVQPMEGFDSDDAGTPGSLSLRRYERYARGGSGLIWFEATAVMNEARSNPRQLWLHEGNVAGYRTLVEHTKRAAREANGHEPLMVIQLTHSGRYSKPTGVPAPIIAHRSPVLDPKHNLPDDYPVVTDEYLDRLQDTYVAAAKLAAKAGFDGIDIKACHRYLVSELLASHTREGRYGGSFENRTRLLRETLARVKEQVPEVFICTRMNAYDAIDYPYGFGVSRDDHRVPDLAEPIELVRLLGELGVPILNISIGNPYFNPHYGRPYDWPIKGVDVPEDHPLQGVARFIGITGQIQQSRPDLPVIASGYTWLRHLMPHVASGVIRKGWATLIGQGRGAFAYPDSVNDILQTGKMDPNKSCVTCSACTQIMRDGGMTGCVVRDSDIYGEQYRESRRLAPDRLRLEADRCRDCETPTCVNGCPAGINIPGFVRAYAMGDLKRSYEILRHSNVLPEMCASVCPVSEQCQGHCIEETFEKNPIPIGDIQRVVSEQARYNGWVGASVPTTGTGCRAAVIGGGPAGLACAIKLLEAGHHVTIIDARPQLGGTPDGMIPAARYPTAQAEIQAILAPARQAGRVELRLGQALGREVELAEIRREFDAVFIGIGLGRSLSLGEADGVVDATDFLQAAKVESPAALPTKVCVLGAGNTAMDAAVTAKRLGADDVFVLYRRSFSEMPAWSEERDNALMAGVNFLILTQPVGYETDAAGKLCGVRVARTQLGEPDESGRRRPVVMPDSESVVECGLAIEAMGQQISASLREALSDLRFSDKGLVEVLDGSGRTSVDGVYAGGDIVNGGTTAVQAIAEGMRAAEAIDRMLATAVK